MFGRLLKQIERASCELGNGPPVKRIRLRGIIGGVEQTKKKKKKKKGASISLLTLPRQKMANPGMGGSS